MYSFNNESPETITKLLEKAGLLEHKNYIPYLAKSKANNANKADTVIRKAYFIYVNIVRQNDKHNLDIDVKG